MARSQDSERYELSDAEKRYLIMLIGKGEPPPEKYPKLRRAVVTAPLARIDLPNRPPRWRLSICGFLGS
jgi:hypothetical protein